MSVAQRIVVGAPPKVAVFDIVLSGLDVVDGFGIWDGEGREPEEEGCDLLSAGRFC